MGVGPGRASGPPEVPHCHTAALACGSLPGSLPLFNEWERSSKWAANYMRISRVSQSVIFKHDSMEWARGYPDDYKLKQCDD